MRTHATNPWFETVGRLVSSARIRIVDGCGHFSMVGEPDAVDRCLETFVADATERGFFA